MVKFVKLLTALTVRRENKSNTVCRRFFSFVLFSDNCPCAFLKALDFEVVILPSAVADSLMGYLHSVKFSQSVSIPY